MVFTISSLRSESSRAFHGSRDFTGMRPTETGRDANCLEQAGSGTVSCHRAQGKPQLRTSRHTTAHPDAQCASSEPEQNPINHHVPRGSEGSEVDLPHVPKTLSRSTTFPGDSVPPRSPRGRLKRDDVVSRKIDSIHGTMSSPGPADGSEWTFGSLPGANATSSISDKFLSHAALEHNRDSTTEPRESSPAIQDPLPSAAPAMIRLISRQSSSPQLLERDTSGPNVALPHVTDGRIHNAAFPVARVVWLDKIIAQMPLSPPATL